MEQPSEASKLEFYFPTPQKDLLEPQEKEEESLQDKESVSTANKQDTGQESATIHERKDLTTEETIEVMEEIIVIEETIEDMEETTEKEEIQEETLREIRGTREIQGKLHGMIDDSEEKNLIREGHLTMTMIILMVLTEGMILDQLEDRERIEVELLLITRVLQGELIPLLGRLIN